MRLCVFALWAAVSATRYAYDAEIRLADSQDVFDGTVVIVPEGASVSGAKDAFAVADRQMEEESGFSLFGTLSSINQAVRNVIPWAYTAWGESAADDTQRRQMGGRTKSKVSRYVLRDEIDEESGLLGEQDAMVFGDTHGPEIRFTLGPQLTVRSVDLAVVLPQHTENELRLQSTRLAQRQRTSRMSRDDSLETAPFDSAFEEHTDFAESNTHLSSKTRKSMRLRKFRALARVAVANHRMSHAEHWINVRATVESPIRGVYVVKPAAGRINGLEAEAFFATLTRRQIALRVKYTGPIKKVPQDMDAHDIERTLWRGGIWRTLLPAGRVVLGATAAGIAGRLGHLARIVPVMRVPPSTSADNASNVEGDEAPICSFATVLEHPQSHEVHTRAAVQSVRSVTERPGMNGINALPTLQTTRFVTYTARDGMPVWHTDIGWLLVPRVPVIEHTLEGRSRSPNTASNLPQTTIRTSIYMPLEIDDFSPGNETHPERQRLYDSIAHAIDQATEALQFLSRTSHTDITTQWLRIFDIPHLAFALRTSLPEGIVVVASTESAEIVRSVARAALLWRNEESRLRRPSPWMPDAIASFFTGRTIDSVHEETISSLPSSLETDGRRTKSLESQSAVDLASITKGVSILRMLARLYGSKVLDAAVFAGDTPLTAIELARRLENVLAYQSTSRLASQNALNLVDIAPFELSPGQRLPSPTAVVQAWTTQASFPVLSVDHKDGELVFTQFPLMETFGARQVWPIPITVYALRDKQDRERRIEAFVASNPPNTPVPHVRGMHGFVDIHYRVLWCGIVAEEPVSIPVPDGTSLRPMNSLRVDGYYRVHYTEDAVRSALFSFHGSDVGASEAADDAFALARYRRASVADVFTVIHTVMTGAFGASDSAFLAAWRFVRSNLNAIHLASRRDMKSAQRIVSEATRDLVFSTLAFQARNTENASEISEDSSHGLRDMAGIAQYERSWSRVAAALAQGKSHSSVEKKDHLLIEPPPVCILKNAVHRMAHGDIVEKARRARLESHLSRSKALDRDNDSSPLTLLNHPHRKSDLVRMRTMDNISMNMKQRLDRDDMSEDGYPMQSRTAAEHDADMDALEQGLRLTRLDGESMEVPDSSTSFKQFKNLFLDPLKNSPEEVCGYLGVGEDDAQCDIKMLNRLLFGIRLQVGDPHAVEVAQRLFEAHVSGKRPLSEFADAALENNRTRNELLDDVFRAAIMYGGEAEWLTMRDMRSGWMRPGEDSVASARRSIEESAANRAAVFRQPPTMLALMAASTIGDVAYYLSDMVFQRLLIFVWITIKSLSKFTPITKPLWDWWNKSFNNLLSEYDFTMNCSVDFTDNSPVIAFLTLTLFRLAIFVWTGFQSLWIARGTVAMRHSVMDMVARRRPQGTWRDRAYERADPSMWVDGAIEYDLDTRERIESAPRHSTYQARIIREEENYENLEVLDDDWDEACVERETKRTQRTRLHYSDGVEPSVDGFHQ